MSSIPITSPNLEPLIDEGVETAVEREFLVGEGAMLMQGYLFCRPAFQGLGKVTGKVCPVALQASVGYSVEA